MTTDYQNNGEQVLDVFGVYELVSRRSLWDEGFGEEQIPLYNLDVILNTALLGEIAEQRSHEGKIAVTFVSREYLHIGLNWVAAMDKIGWHHYIVIAGDSETHELFRMHGTSSIKAEVRGGSVQASYLSQGGFTRKGLAMNALKFPVVSALLHRGLDVIMSDADATWLDNPMPSIAAKADIAFQRVFYHPAAIAKVWGFAACSGFVFFRSSPGSIAFVNHCVLEHRRVQCDQVALNLALLASEVRWMFPPGYHHQQNSVPDDEKAKEFFRSIASKLILGHLPLHCISLAALPHDTFWRHDWVEANPAKMVLCHPNTAKNDEAKIARCEQLGIRYT